MARRMIHTSIWESEQFSKLSNLGRLIFIGIITHADDEGRFKASAKLLGSKIFPYDAIEAGEIEKEIKAVADTGLIRLYEIENEKYGYLPTWEKYQTLRTDRLKPSSIPAPADWQPSGNQMTTTRQPNVRVREDKIREVKVSKDKRSKEKRIPTLEGSTNYLKAIPQGDVDEFLKRFVATEKQIRSKGEDLYLYCERKGRQYKNYKAFLLNALKRDFKEREDVPTSKYGGVKKTVAEQK